MSRNHHDGVSEQTKASGHRFEDASLLLRAARWRGAMYVAGYAVECLLKAKLMRMFDCRTLRELEAELQRRGTLRAGASVFTHQLGILLRLAQGADRLRQNQPLWRKFNIVNRWVPAWRYSADLSNQADAEDFCEAVKSIVGWIENNI